MKNVLQHVLPGCEWSIGYFEVMAESGYLPNQMSASLGFIFNTLEPIVHDQASYMYNK